MYQRWLEAFHAVARFGSFTAAAKKLGIGQPTVSTHVKALEDRFRVELFYRNGRSISLTPIGSALLDITQGLYGHEEEAIALLQSARSHDVGSLRIAALRPTEAIELVTEFHAGHPNVRLHVEMRPTPNVFEQLLRFECDIGIVGYEPTDPRFFSIDYARHAIVLVLNERNRLSKKRRIKLEELENEKIIARAKGSTTREAFDSALARKGIHVRRVLETDSREAVLRAVAHGIGIGVITDSEFVPLKGIHAVPIAGADLFTYAHVVCLAERRTRPLISAFLDIAAKNSKTKPRNQR